MPELKEYKVAVTEVYRKTVTVRGTGERDAHQRAWDGWLNGEIILTEDDFEGSEFYLTALDGAAGLSFEEMSVRLAGAVPVGIVSSKFSR